MDVDGIKGKAIICKVDIDTCPELAKEAGVTALPTFQFYIGKEVQNKLLAAGGDEDQIETNVEKDGLIHEQMLKNAGITLRDFFETDDTLEKKYEIQGSDVDGVIEEILVEDARPVQFGQVLFKIRKG